MGFVKNILYRIASSKLIPFFTQKTIFPYYHIVRNNQVDHIEYLYSYKNEHQFKQDIDFLLQHYNPIESIDQLRNDQLKNSFLLSFDDGLEEVYSVVFPILKEKNIKAFFFLNPNFVDNVDSLYKHDISVIIKHLNANQFEAKATKVIASIMQFDFASNEEFISKFKNTKFADRHKIKEVIAFLGIDMKHYLTNQKVYLSKKQIQEMLDYGMFFGGHTMSHPPLAQLSHEEKKAEIIDSIEWVKTNFKVDYSAFAFPFTDKNSSKKLFEELFEYDKNILIFGNSGLKRDIDNRIIQRFSLENPNKTITKVIVTEHLYKLFNKMTGNYQIKRK